MTDHYLLAAAACDALFRKVTPNLRSLSCEMRAGKVFIQYVYETEPSDDDNELRYLFEGYFLVNLSSDADYDYELLVLGTAQTFKALSVKVYGRFEGMGLA